MRQSPTICIVDDDRHVRDSLENFLRSVGMTVRTFASAESFLAERDQSGIDCLITDLHMPGIDGLGLQAELNRIGRDFPVIVMTAYPTAAAREQSAHLGASAFIEKPIDPDSLLDRVEEILS